MNHRIAKLIDRLRAEKLDCLVLNPGPTLEYLTSLQFHLMERPTVAIFTADGRVGLVLPTLERQKVDALANPVEVFTYGEDPLGWPEVFEQAFRDLNLENSRIAIEPTRLRVLELRLLEKAAGSPFFLNGEDLIAGLRMRKDSTEINQMRQAAEIAQKALLSTLPRIRLGMTEKEIASELVVQLYYAGSDSELPFHPIVSTGPNTANPHAIPSERVLREGDLLLFDWGASKDGYYSDITRTFTAGEVDQELLRIGEIVLAANTWGRRFGKEGIPAGAVDLSVRSIIEQSGYGPWFIHRTGHGLGMEAHEAPYIYQENELVLTAGMVFTIEPGIYLPGKGGVRIEDDVVVTVEGLISLTDMNRALVSFDSNMNR